MNQEKPISPGAIETAHFETGPCEVQPPRPYTEGSDRSSGEVYVFPMPSAPVPKWVSDSVARRREAAEKGE